MSHAGGPAQPYDASGGGISPIPGASLSVGGNVSATAIVPAPAGMPPLPTRRNGYEQGAVHHWAAGILARLRRAEQQARELAEGAAQGAEKAADTPASRQNVENQIADLLKMAADEAEGNRLGAARQAADLVSKAEQEARTIVVAAKEQAEIVMATAREQAKAQLDDASVKAAAVDEGARRRMTAIVALHSEATTRLEHVRDVTTQLLDAEQERGSLAGEVARALPPGSTFEGGQEAAGGAQDAHRPGTGDAPGPESGGVSQAESSSASSAGGGPAPQRP